MADIPTSHNFVPQDDYNARLCGICGYSKAQHTTKPIAESGWTNRFTSAIGYYFLRERGEDTADASIIEYQGGERAYISGADDNFYKEWASGRYEFLGPFTASDFEQLIQLRKAASDAMTFLDAINSDIQREPSPREGVLTISESAGDGSSYNHALLNTGRLAETVAALREALTPKGDQS